MSEQSDILAFSSNTGPLRQRPDGQLDPAGETGWYLERERRRRGLSLHEVCDATGIHPHHLQGLETGELTSLPTRAETLHLLAVYANHLGFDPAPLCRHYAEILPRTAIVQRSQNAKAPKPFSSARIIPFWAAFKLPPIKRTGGAIASALAAIVMFSAASSYMSPAGLPTATGPDITAAIDQAPAPQLPPQSMSELIARELNSPSDAQSLAKARVVLTARGPVWLRVVDGEGSVIMSGILKAGARYAVPEVPGVSVIARDGGLVTYTLDGKDKGPLGRAGEIIVGKPISAAALLDGRG